MAAWLDFIMKLSVRYFLTLLFLSGSGGAGQPRVVPPPRTERVVLVHGFLENGQTFKMLKKRLESRGVRCFVPRLRPSDGRGGLENLAVRLKQDIEVEFGTEMPISIVAFSMGGLVSRVYLQNLGGAKRCENLITISSPHQGTNAAWAYPTKGAEQMRPGSQFLVDLRGTEDQLGKMPVVSYRTPMDLVILPPTRSIWERADNLEFPVLMHPLMMTDAKVLDDIERRLLEAGLSMPKSMRLKESFSSSRRSGPPGRFSGGGGISARILASWLRQSSSSFQQRSFFSSIFSSARPTPAGNQK